MATAEQEALAEKFMEDLEKRGGVSVEELTDQYFPQPEDGDSEIANIDRDKRASHYIEIYSLQDGKPSQVPSYMLANKVSQRDRFGKPVFTPVKSRAPEYMLGTIKCLLHPENEEADLMREIGAVAIPCHKSNLRTKLDLRRHMEHRHSDEWNAYQEHLAEVEKQAEREHRENLAALLKDSQKGKPGRPRKNPELEEANESASEAV